MEQDIKEYSYLVDLVLNKLRLFINRDEYRQIGLIALWQALENYDVQQGKPEPYLYTKIRFRLLTELRHKYREMEYEVQDEQLFLFINQEDKALQMRLEMAQLLDTLNEEERQLIEFIYYRGYKARELANYLGISEDTVKRRKKRILNKLRHSLT